MLLPLMTPDPREGCADGAAATACAGAGGGVPMRAGRPPAGALDRAGKTGTLAPGDSWEGEFNVPDRARLAVALLVLWCVIMYRWKIGAKVAVARQHLAGVQWKYVPSAEALPGAELLPREAVDPGPPGPQFSFSAKQVKDGGRRHVDDEGVHAG